MVNLSALKTQLREVLLGGQQRVLGDPSNIGSRVLKAVILLSAMGAAAAVWALLIEQMDPHQSSFGVAAPFFKFATSTWSYVVVELILLRGLLRISDSRKARQSGSYLGMEPDAILRIAAEAKSTTGSTRVVCTSEDAVQEIRERLSAGMESGEDDVLKRDTPSAAAAQEHVTERLSELEEGRAELLETSDTLEEEIDGLLSGALEGEQDLSALQESDTERLSLYELLDESGQADVDAAEELMEKLEHVNQQIQEVTEEREALVQLCTVGGSELQEAASDAAALETELQAAGYDSAQYTEQHTEEVERELPTLLEALRPALQGGAAAAVVLALIQGVKTALPVVGELLPGMQLPVAAFFIGLLLHLGIRGGVWYRTRKEALRGDSTADTSTEHGLPWEAGFKLWRMDAAASLQSGDLLWQFVAPAAVSFAGMVVIAGIWLTWWVYPLLLSGGVLIGALNYARISRSRERELRALRSTSDREAWDACSVLIKGPVQAGTTEMCYAWFNGAGYAHHDRERLCAELAPRVHQLLNGEEPDPSVLRKYYRNTKDLYPDLTGWRRNVEEHRISEELIKTVERAPDGIMPKAKLIEDVVLHDKDNKLWGLYQSGLGYDPELVRECYCALYPYALVEEEMEVEGTGGEMHSLTAVRLRTDPLPAELSEVRAQFSSRFRAYAEFEPLYPLPEVDPSEEIQLPTRTPGGAL